MSEVYIEVVLNAPADDALRELLSFQLHGLGFSGFLETDNGFHCYIPKVLWDNALKSKLHSIMEEQRPSPIAISGITEIENQNWNRQWEESIQPVEVSERIVITPVVAFSSGKSGETCSYHRSKNVVWNRLS